MGVRGLTTFIDSRHEKYLKKFKLHDCYIIIDGSSISYQIYLLFSSRAHCAFGGNYDQFAQYIRDFFLLLSKCGVTPIVVFDGGYEPRKIGTVIKRMKDRTKALTRLLPGSEKCVPVFPLLMKNVVKQVLRELNVLLVQCDNEADQEIASLARKYCCPVISNDSDFYIYDVSYIPITSIKFEAVPLKFQLDQPSEKFCINCEIYKVEFFLNSFGCLDKSMMPLLGTLLGNDYVKYKVFRQFLAQFPRVVGNCKKRKNRVIQGRIAQLIEWMKHETFDSAVEKVLARMKVLHNRDVKNSLMKGLNAYKDIISTVEQYLPLELKSSINLENSSKLPEIDMENADSSNIENEMDVDINEGDPEGHSQATDESSLSGDESSLSEDEDSLSENKDDESSKLEGMDVEMIEEVNDIKAMAGKSQIEIPDWLKDSSRRGNIEPCVFDILTLRAYFTLPQAEDNLHRSSHAISVPIIKKICKLLLGNHFQEVSLYMKNGNCCIQRFLLHLTNTPLIIDIDSVPSKSVDDRKALLLQCLDIPSDFCIDSFPEEWQLYMCVILFWIKANGEPKVTESHVISLLMCVVALSIIDLKVGVHKKKITFFKKYGKMQKKIIKRIEYGFSSNEQNESNCDDGSKVTTEKSSEFTTTKQIYSSINLDECIAVFDVFYQLHQLNVGLTLNRNVLWSTVHSFAQFQSCLYHVIILNSLLGQPFDQPCASRLYSSTFIFNTCCALNQVRSAIKHIQSLLRYSPNIVKLIETMYSALTAVVPVAPIQSLVKRKKSYKRKKKASISTDTSDINIDGGVNKVVQEKAVRPSSKRNKHKRRKKASEVVKNIGSNDVKDEEGGSEDHESYQDENNVFALLSAA